MRLGSHHRGLRGLRGLHHCQPPSILLPLSVAVRAGPVWQTGRGAFLCTIPQCNLRPDPVACPCLTHLCHPPSHTRMF